MTWALAHPLMREAFSSTQEDVTPVMGAVFDHLPVSQDDLRYLSLGALGSGQAGDLVAVFLLLLLLDLLAFAQIVAGMPNRDELPVSAETGLFGGGLFALEAPTLQPPVLLAPTGVVFTEKKSCGNFTWARSKMPS